MKTEFEVNLLVVKLVRAVHGNLFAEALIKEMETWIGMNV
jgi:hypothetical protein